MPILDLDGYFWIPRTLISTCTDFQLNPFWGAWGRLVSVLGAVLGYVGFKIAL